MADLNALIAQGYQFQPAPDPFAQYAKMQQLDVGEQTNQLNRMKMQEYQRGMEEINAMRKLDPSSATYLQDITRINPEKGFAFAKSEQERKNLVSTGEHLNAQTKGLTIKALGDTFDNFTKLNPPTTASTSPKGVTAYITNLYSDPLLGAVAAKQMPLEQALQVNLEAAAKDPKAWATAHLGLTGDKLFESMKGTRQNVSMGGTSQGQTIDAYGNVVPGSTVNTLMTMTPGEKSTAATAASRLAQEANTPQYMVTDQGVVALPKNPKPGAITGSVVIGPSGEPLQKELKPIPANINTAIITNNQSLKSIDEAIRLIKQNPDAVGWKGYAPNKLLNESNPEGVDARAAISNIGSLKLHERSGAAVTASEFPRLAPFIPLATDDADTVVKKLQQMKTIAQGEQQGLTETYTKDQGYRPNPILNPKGAPAAVPKPSGIPTGWVLHTDAAGRKAYVSPNGKDFKEVP